MFYLNPLIKDEVNSNTATNSETLSDVPDERVEKLSDDSGGFDSEGKSIDIWLFSASF